MFDRKYHRTFANVQRRNIRILKRTVQRNRGKLPISQLGNVLANETVPVHGQVSVQFCNDPPRRDILFQRKQEC